MKINYWLLINWKTVSPWLLLLFSVVAVFSYACFYYLEIKSSVDVKRNQIIIIKQNIETAINDKARLEIYEKDLSSMSEKGYIGDAQRLQWIEVLRKVIADYNIPKVKFSLQPTVKHEANENAGFNGQGESLLSITPMMLQMELMHERDFYDFIKSFKSQAKGVFRIEDCKIQSLKEDKKSNIAKMSADCHLTWLNYDDIRKNWEKSL